MSDQNFRNQKKATFDEDFPDNSSVRAASLTSRTSETSGKSDKSSSGGTKGFSFIKTRNLFEEQFDHVDLRLLAKDFSLSPRFINKTVCVISYEVALFLYKRMIGPMREASRLMQGNNEKSMYFVTFEILKVIAQLSGESVVRKADDDHGGETLNVHQLVSEPVVMQHERVLKSRVDLVKGLATANGNVEFIASSFPEKVGNFYSKKAVLRFVGEIKRSIGSDVYTFPELDFGDHENSIFQCFAEIMAALETNEDGDVTESSSHGVWGGYGDNVMWCFSHAVRDDVQPYKTIIRQSPCLQFYNPVTFEPTAQTKSVLEFLIAALHPSMLAAPTIDEVKSIFEALDERDARFADEDCADAFALFQYDAEKIDAKRDQLVQKLTDNRRKKSASTSSTPPSLLASALTLPPASSGEIITPSVPLEPTYKFPGVRSLTLAQLSESLQKANIYRLLTRDLLIGIFGVLRVAHPGENTAKEKVISLLNRSVKAMMAGMKAILPSANEDTNVLSSESIATITAYDSNIKKTTKKTTATTKTATTQAVTTTSTVNQTEERIPVAMSYAAAIKSVPSSPEPVKVVRTRK